jgi:hypothetical protein
MVRFKERLKLFLELFTDTSKIRQDKSINPISSKDTANDQILQRQVCPQNF